MNIFSNFLTNKIGAFTGQDHPWFGKKIKFKIEMKNRVYKDYIKNGWPETVYYLIQNVTSEISSYISKCKNDYFIPLEKSLVILLGPQSHTVLQCELYGMRKR